MMSIIKIDYLANIDSTFVEVRHDYPVTIWTSWGDRSEPSGRINLYTTDPDDNGVTVEVSDSGLRAYCIPRPGDRYQCDIPIWAKSLPETRELVIKVLQEETALRPEVKAARAEYAAIVADIQREYATHENQWRKDVAVIARMFRRKFIQVGEQTVPGKCVVLSKRGKVLGYADVLNGKWLGTIERN